MDDISRILPESDEDELIGQVKLGLEQAKRGEGRPASEYIAEALARLKQNFPDFKPALRKARPSGR